ncbi:MAG: hypothetical protein IJT45_06605 [Bacteroidales bacterium]|nr:hypothetical protein [Bacteroidales bacterium]
MKKLFLSLIILFLGITLYAQDVIVTNDGNKIEAKVTEVEVDVIKYKKFGDNNGPTYTMKKTEIATILYENGTVDVFKKEAQPQQKTNNMYGDPYYGYNNYNPYSIPGKGLRTTGIVFMSVGGAALIGGVILGITDESWAWFTLVPAGAAFLGSGVIFTAVGQSRMNRYMYYQQQNQVYSLYDIELNKDSKKPVKLGVGVNGVALKF